MTCLFRSHLYTDSARVNAYCIETRSMLERRRCKPRASSLNVNHFARSTSLSRIATRLELPTEQTMPTHAAAGLSELVLSSTHAASPLPTISLHNPLTGALVYSFRSPVASTSHASSSSTGLARNGIGNAADRDQPSLENRTTFAAVEGGQGCGGYLVGLGGKEGRAGLNVWNFTRVRNLRSPSRVRSSFPDHSLGS